MNDLISIIVPVYNAEKYIKNCINSLLKQTYSNFELILIDDGSIDKSYEICNQFARIDNRIKLYRQKNGGASAARNTGLKYAKGSYLIFVDSDDYVSINYLKNLYLAAKQNDFDVVQCKLKVIYQQINDNLQVEFNSNDVQEISKIEALNERKYKVSVCGKIYKKEIFNGFSFKEGIIYEDDASYYIFVDRAKHIGLLNETLYYYYMSDNSVMRNHNVDKSTAFIDIYHERINYFKNRGNIELMEGTYNRYCLILMLNYSLSISKSINKNDREKFLEEFKKYYSLVVRSENVSKKDKIMFKIFMISPRCVGTLIGMIKK